MQKIELDDEGWPIPAQRRHAVTCLDCQDGEVLDGDALVSCGTCEGYGLMWEDDAED